MFFHVARAKSLALAFIASAAAFYAHAQGDDGNSSGQPVIFSAPQNETSASAPTVAPQRTPQLESSTMPQAPQIFSQPPRFSMPQSQQHLPPQKSQQDNWTLLTPAEILGVESPDKFLKSQQQQDYEKERDGNTTLERFLKRQSEMQAGITNHPVTRNTASGWDFSHMDEKRDSFELRNDFNFRGSQKNNDDYLQSSLNEWTMNPRKKRDNNSDATSQLPPNPVSAQQAALARFEEMLAPSPKTETTIGSASKTVSPIQPLIDPNLQPQPQVNPIGTSYKPLESGIVKPTGITPLPTLTGSPVAPPVAAPSWAPKPAPWLSQTPQPFTIPQRKF